MAQTVNHQITWTCDQCGKQETDTFVPHRKNAATFAMIELHHFGEPPFGWAILNFSQGDNSEDVHLCSVECLHQYAAFLLDAAQQFDQLHNAMRSSIASMIEDPNTEPR